MNPPEISIEEQAEAFAAWKRGEEVEYWDTPTFKWDELRPHCAVARTNIIRRKPKPSLRPWEPEEVPLGAWIRRKDGYNKYRGLISAADEQRVWATSSHTYELALKEFEHSIDGGRTWLPCGVETA